ncbi:DUF1127 domain-containing protein [Sinisalibacter aestuarii]|uniref:DUF1127 domain-containing protein n=1 Tax=Sinisalibacter aestuarii TaxID=2949426 RepID=A0ABQ5LQP2_9RHOB|nr:DUF1127 domain-containing protein [Sinisalibacter aestuarii]GKY87278.1 hypothetical protein STA1M1_11470 [Sinisalibacter aestuarii]
MHTMTATHHIRHRNARRWLSPLTWIKTAVKTHRQRLRLEDLDAHMLEDIGIDRATARREARRPFWDLPR